MNNTITGKLQSPTQEVRQKRELMAELRSFNESRWRTPTAILVHATGTLTSRLDRVINFGVPAATVTTHYRWWILS